MDRCPVCKGVWLDPDELEMLKDSSTNSNLATGICLGIAIG
ncbi:zf-TFIIB domain-containing protein [Vibrio parahaemolyticus]